VAGSVLGLIERVERVDEQRTEETPGTTVMTSRRQVGRLELGYETLQTRVELERQQQVQHFHRSTHTRTHRDMHTIYNDTDTIQTLE